LVGCPQIIDMCGIALTDCDAITSSTTANTINVTSATLMTS